MKIKQPPIEFIPQEKAVEMIEQSFGHFISVRFIKRTDGSERLMLCRLGVTKHLKGGVLRYSPAAKNLIPVFDIIKGEYRMISKEGIFEITYKGICYLITKS